MREFLKYSFPLVTLLCIIKAQGQKVRDVCGETIATYTNESYHYHDYLEIRPDGNGSFSFEAGVDGDVFVIDRSSNPTSGRCARQNNPYFTKVEVIRKAGVKTEGAIDLLTEEEKITSVTHYDGLMRTIQTSMVEASPNKKDIVQPVVYDAYGRVTTSYLPYESTTHNGSYQTGIIDQQKAFYENEAAHIENSSYAFSKVKMDNSPVTSSLGIRCAGLGLAIGKWTY